MQGGHVFRACSCQQLGATWLFTIVDGCAQQHPSRACGGNITVANSHTSSPAMQVPASEQVQERLAPLPTPPQRGLGPLPAGGPPQQQHPAAPTHHHVSSSLVSGMMQQRPAAAPAASKPRAMNLHTTLVVAEEAETALLARPGQGQPVAEAALKSPAVEHQVTPSLVIPPPFPLRHTIVVRQPGRAALLLLGACLPLPASLMCTSAARSTSLLPSLARPPAASPLAAQHTPRRA